ncbi:hypothetical protein [Streptomyces sp. Tu6071]|uniref:hypothetical protein n=1 Tax=Streptomyces sp. Tu6071 TaxID=355249 RepID=UPI001319E640|nr:hypothetical protein [Streptomyces sp. Tu6071]
MNRNRSVRMVVYLVDLGEGALPVNAAKNLLLEEASGGEEAAKAAWQDAGLPEAGVVTYAELDRARGRLR